MIKKYNIHANYMIKKDHTMIESGGKEDGLGYRRDKV